MHSIGIISCWILLLIFRCCVFSFINREWEWDGNGSGVGQYSVCIMVVRLVVVVLCMYVLLHCMRGVCTSSPSPVVCSS
jgi:uncharacterized membrane protein